MDVQNILDVLFCTTLLCNNRCAHDFRMERSANVGVLDILSEIHEMRHLFCCNTMQDHQSCVGCQMLNCGLTQREHLPLGHPPSGKKSSSWRGIGMGISKAPDILTLSIGTGLMTHAVCAIGAVADTCKLHILLHFLVARRRCQEDSIFMICLTKGRGCCERAVGARTSWTEMHHLENLFQTTQNHFHCHLMFHLICRFDM